MKKKYLSKTISALFTCVSLAAVSPSWAELTQSVEVVENVKSDLLVDNPVEDPALQACLIQQFGEDAKIQDVVHIGYNFCDIRTFNGIEQFVSLKEIHLVVEGNLIDLSALTKVRLLERIDVSNQSSLENELNDIEFIFEDMPNLERLSLEGFSIKSLQLSRLPVLAQMSFTGENRDSDFVFEDLPSLSFLDLEVLEINKLRLANLPRLHWLDLGAKRSRYDREKAILEVELTNLPSLLRSRNDFLNLDTTTTSYNISDLILSSDKITIEGTLPKIKSLVFDDYSRYKRLKSNEDKWNLLKAFNVPIELSERVTNLESDEPISFNGLSSVKLSINSTTQLDLSFVEFDNQIKTLELSLGDNVTNKNLRGLSSIPTSLETLSIHAYIPYVTQYVSWFFDKNRYPNGSLIDASLLPVMDKLNQLTLRGLGLNELPPLSNFPLLKLLDLRGGNISDLTALNQSPNIEDLTLSNNLIEDLEPLRNLNNLTVLRIFRNPIRDGSLLLEKGLLKHNWDDDGVDILFDNCPLVSNSNQWDSDGDGIGNQCDLDIDGDGCSNFIEDALNTKPWDANSVPEVCKLPSGDDSDNDGVRGDLDNCPLVANPGQWDKDEDGIGNECDLDIDGDMCTNDIEIALGFKPWNPNSVPEVCEMPDGGTTDSDNDGFVDSIDNCPQVANEGQWDKDKDGIGNECDLDIDGDLCPNDIELALGTKPWNMNSVPANCEMPVGNDSDNDGIVDSVDNCVNIANPGQWDKDDDNIGNECDDDIDGDGFTNQQEREQGTKEWNANSFPDIAVADIHEVSFNGETLVAGSGEQAGFALYVFDKDLGEVGSVCNGECEDHWPPLLVADSEASGIADLSSIIRDDGSEQVAYKGRPLYFFAGDIAVGDENGQSLGNVWWIAEENQPVPPINEVALQEGKLVAGSGEQAGFALYVFDKDLGIDGSVCNDECEDHWPPLLVADAQASGLAHLSSVIRDDGSEQVAYKGRPLYFFAGDAVAGDENGQGLGKVWWIAEENQPEPPVDEVALNNEFLVVAEGDKAGFSLYFFDNDLNRDGSVCNDGCAATWPPLLLADAQASGLSDDSELGSITRDDGTEQVTYKERPVYLFAGDSQAGDQNGQGIGGVWWLAE